MIDILIIMISIIIIGLILIIFEEHKEITIILCGFITVAIIFYISRNISDKTLSLTLNYVSVVLLFITLFIPVFIYLNNLLDVTKKEKD